MNPLSPEIEAVIKNEARYWAPRMKSVTEYDLIQEGYLMALQAEWRDPDPLLFFRVTLRNRYRNLVRAEKRRREAEPLFSSWLTASSQNPERVAAARQALQRLLHEHPEAVDFLLSDKRGARKKAQARLRESSD